MSFRISRRQKKRISRRDRMADAWHELDRAMSQFCDEDTRALYLGWKICEEIWDAAEARLRAENRAKYWRGYK